MSFHSEHYLDPPVACETLDRLVARCGGSLEVRTPATYVEYALPPHLSPEIRNFLLPSAQVDFPTAAVAVLPGGRVFGSGNVLSPDGKTIARDVSPDFGKAFAEHWLLTYKKIPPPVPLPGTTAVIATTLGVGYSHWMLDELPRLLALKLDHGASLIAHASTPPQKAAFALHGFSGRVIEAKRNSHFSCAQLIVPSLGQLTAATIQALNEFVGPLRCGTSVEFGERLYISREKARRRRVVNESELWSVLASRGFAKLHLEELTWPQQIDAFRAAKIVVAPHGAGLANLAFCSPGTKVIELFNRSYVNGCYWQLAALKALDYRPVMPLSAEPLAQILSANRSDIMADVALVVDALRS